MKLVFERSTPGHQVTILPECDVSQIAFDGDERQAPLRLPELAETEVSRHYTQLNKQVHGVNDGFYPLGSCTMKYNPRINEQIASLESFADIHPLQPENTVLGCKKVMELVKEYLCEISGMDDLTFQPSAGAHGELTGIMLIKAYHEDRKDFKRTKMLVPDSAHGTNPATASMVGYDTVHIPSNAEGCVDIEVLKKSVGEDTAGLMLTNPNTLGLFEKDILEITKIVHDAGGLVYYDGANLNAVMGIARPGDMGFDVVHYNVHKTLSTPHGGGGPGGGPVGCKECLVPFLPASAIGEEVGPKSIGQVRSFYGNFLVAVRALTYVLTLGKEGIPQAAMQAVLNANYLMNGMKKNYQVAYDKTCMHEFVLTLSDMKKNYGITAIDIAKGLLDYGMHPPTMYFPLIVDEALMLEPTETESKETLDEAIKVFDELARLAKNDPEKLKQAPLTTPVRRLDEVKAARHPILKYSFETSEE